MQLCIREEDTIVQIRLESGSMKFSTVSKVNILGQELRLSAYNQVLRYVERNKGDWSRIQDAEVEVSLVKPDYILLGKVDLIKVRRDTR